MYFTGWRRNNSVLSPPVWRARIYLACLEAPVLHTLAFQLAQTE